MDVVEFILTLGAIVAVGWVGFWFVDNGLPAPFQVFGRVVVAVLGLLALAYFFLPNGLNL